MSEQPLVIEPVNVPRLLEDLMVEMGPAADSKGILLGGIVSNAAPRDIPHISADPVALREIFSNLMENAIKHNKSGTEVTVDVRQENNQLVVQVFDDGIGMPPETLANIFEKGRRSYGPGAARGTGMGLYLSKLLVELHGGDITASSRDNKGTEFRITLPIRRTR